MRTQVSLLATATLAAAVSGSLGDSVAQTSADPLCYAATVDTAFGNVTVGPHCIPYNGATICGPIGTGLGPVFSVSVSACIPALLQGGVSNSRA